MGSLLLRRLRNLGVGAVTVTVTAAGLSVVSPAVSARADATPILTAAASKAALMSAGPTIVPDTDITQDVTWTPEGSPYLVDGRVRVEAGATLTLLPGTVVKFVPTSERATNPTSYNNSQILVYGGRLVARGTGAEPVVFTSSHDDTVGGDTNGGGRAPERGDWASLRFTAPSDAVAVEMPTSVLANVIIRYGAETTSIVCQGSGSVDITNRGRVRLTRAEVTDALGPGVSIAVPEVGIGYASVSHTLFARSRCGADARSGTLFNNIFDATLDFRSIYSGYPEGLRVYGSYMMTLATFAGSPGPTSEQADVRANYFDKGIFDAPSNQDHQDLSWNAWGEPRPNIGSCFDSDIDYVPAVKHQYNGVSCEPGNPSRITDYFTRVLPIVEPPPVPEVGPGAAVSAPAAVPWGQMLGGLGASEYAYPAQGSMADPVATATGAYVEERVDVFVPTPRLALVASRTYNSADPAVGWLGRGWHFGYEAHIEASSDGDVVVLHAEDGQQVRYDRQADGSYRGGPGVTARLSRDGDGWLLTTRAQLDRRFGPAGRLRSITEANGNTIWLNYDETGNLTSAVGSGRTVIFQHNASGRITRVTLDDGRYVGYGYTDGLLTSVRDLAGRTTTYGYDAEERLTSKTNNVGHQVMRLAYHPTTGRVRDQWDALNHHTQFGWDAATGTATMTDPRGQVWTDRYDGNLLLARTAPDGATTTYAYDADLQLIETNGPRGVINEFTYSAAGDLISTTTPTGTVTTVYDQRHRPIESVNARGTRVEYRYDAADNLTRIIRPEPGSPTGTLETSFDYSDRGMLLSTTDARGRTSTNTYTPEGDLASSTSPAGSKTTYNYDVTGRLTSVVDPRGNQTGAIPADFTSEYTYTDDDQPLEQTDPLGRTTSHTYDSLGRVKTVIDAKDRVTTYTYDRASRVTSIQGPDPSVPATTYVYDANSNLTSETDSAGRTVTYAYDPVNRMAKATTPLGVYNYAYDKAGNLTKVTDPTAKATAMSYDAANRLIGIDYPSGTTDVTYRYDANGNRKKMTDAAGTVTYTYDKLDRLTAVTRGSSVFRYGYDAVGGISQMTYPDGTVYDYTFDDDHRLDLVQQGGTTLADYSYDAAGLPATVTRANTTTATYTYDPAGQLTRVRDVGGAGATPLLLDESYTYDDTGNLTRIAGSPGERVFKYDALDRLTETCYDTTTCDDASDYVRWTYDAVGNRTNEIRPTGTTTYTYAPSTGLLSSTSGPDGTTSFAYDALGQLKTETPAGGAATTYAYNAAGRVTSQAVAGGATTTYTYDGDGRRLTSSTSGVSTGFLWNPLSYQLASESSGGSTVRRYAYGLGPIGVQRPTQTGTDFYHLDRMGSVRAVTNSAAAPQWTNEWEPYGLPRTSTKVDPSAAVNPIGWTGQYADPTGSIHLRARQYNPALGRFTAPDQAAAMPYSATGTYAAGNPLAFADPTGLWPSPGDVWNAVTTGAAVVAPIAGMAAPFSGPLAPIVGGVAIAAGAITAIDSAYDAYQVCSGNEKGSCAGEIALGAVGMATGGLGRTAIRSSLAARTAARSCSFTGATVVLMADGSKKPIEDVEVGDRVIATDPETGEQTAKAVTHTWVHDDMVIDLVVDGAVITTTEDHPFWSVTDQRFERADELRRGERVLNADGQMITVSGLRFGTAREALAYNLTVEGIHTYHVGEDEVLVHNTCPVDRYRGVLEPRHMDAARRELNGEVVARRPDGVPFDHVTEVREAMNGLRNTVIGLQRKLGHPGLTAGQRAATEASLSAGSRLLDWAKDWLR
jgi:RHS repeat-associated protein